MTILVLQIAALAVVALLLRAPAREPARQEVREPIEKPVKR